MKKLIMTVLMMGSLAMGEYTRAELEGAVDRKLTQAEETCQKFLAPLTLFDGNKYETVLCATAWMVCPVSFKDYAVPPAAVERIYGDASLSVQLKDFSIATQELPGDRFAFMLSANYNVAPKQPSRDQHTSAEDVLDWVPYIEALGYSFTDVLNREEFDQLLNEEME